MANNFKSLMEMVASNDKEGLYSLALSQVLRAQHFEIVDDLLSYNAKDLIRTIMELNPVSKQQKDFYDSLEREGMAVAVVLGFTPMSGYEYRMAIDQFINAFSKMPPSDIQREALESRGLPVPSSYWAARDAVRTAQKTEYQALPATESQIEYAKKLCEAIGQKWKPSFAKMSRPAISAQIKTWRTQAENELASADQIERLAKLYSVALKTKYTTATKVITDMQLSYGAASAMIRELTDTSETDTATDQAAYFAKLEEARFNKR